MDTVDEHRPVVTGDIPVKLVELTDITGLEEKANGVADPVADNDRAIGINRAGNVDVIPARPAGIEPVVIDYERTPVVVGDRSIDDVEFYWTFLGSFVAEREVAVQSVPLAGEADGESLDHVRRSVGVNSEQRVEVVNADLAGLGARRARDRG